MVITHTHTHAHTHAHTHSTDGNYTRAHHTHTHTHGHTHIHTHRTDGNCTRIHTHTQPMVIAHTHAQKTVKLNLYKNLPKEKFNLYNLYTAH